jgi:hypothetical protein
MQWQHADGPPGADLAAALGTAMAIYQRDAESEGPNLIASTLAQLREPIRPILVRSLAPVAAVLAIATTLLGLHLAQLRETSVLRTELESLTPASVRATELRLTLLGARNKLKQLQALEKALPHPDWQQMLSRISQSMPEDVWLDRLTVHDGRSASLTGASYTDSGVYDFVGYLKQVPDIAEIALEGTGVTQTATGPTTNFNLQLTLSNLAGRNESEVRHD